MKTIIINSIILFSITVLIVTTSCSQTEKKQNEEYISMKYKGLVKAPEFPEGLQWLNTVQPITLKELKGKFVLLDFWTYCCINCIHIMPDLKKLEEEFPDELVIIGVHSAKFKNEKEKDNIRKAILRYEIKHPVVNDLNFEIWNDYAVSAWPTLVLINPLGQIIMQSSGEGVYAKFDTVIKEATKEFDAAGLLDKNPIKFKLESEHNTNSILHFPAKVFVSKTNKIYITDSNNNKILIVDANGKILSTIGDGKIGRKDGSYEESEFNHPQGIAVDEAEENIYIADTDNHLIRRINLKEKKVETIAGKGHLAIQYYSNGGFGTNSELNSPWDLVVVGNTLYIAMAGPHQIWKMDLETKKIEPFAGTGYENIVDGNLKMASFAQPSGISYCNDKLYIADSEVSAIREINLLTGQVSTLVGVGLFDFGDVDGYYPKSRLQHCIGINCYNNLIYIADTYNNKIKVLNPETKEVRTLIGTGKPGIKDGNADEAQFDEPNGLFVHNNLMYITDTNNNLIRIYDFNTKDVKTFKITQ
jgi:DNA-binding beta-propeller fold protein YncE